ncbi:YheT family hydrolase [Coraliomargarita akajimensis]|nr:alpha/beta fold hydrolase [Coraliomargarita akajimensis]
MRTIDRERIDTPDGDFLDLDWARPHNGKQLVVITHGLEGSTEGPYVQGMAHAFVNAGWDVCAWNFRGCSGETNRLLRTYHSGASEELATVLAHVYSTTPYSHIALIGFSLGGNLQLKYLGERGNQLDDRLCGAVALSVPCDLASSAKRLEHWSNRIYMRRFMNYLRPKVRDKLQRFPTEIEDHGLDQMRTFAEFDNAYTAPIHGFKDASDYWEQSRCDQYLGDIRVPTLLINAVDDPFLTESCFPRNQAASSDYFYLETPERGGHVGFIQFSKSKLYWSEHRALEFLS